MQIAETQNHLSDVKLNLRLTESFLVLKYFVQLASLEVRHDEVQPQFSLEKVVHAAQELMVGVPEDLVLKTHSFYLVVVNEFVLPDSFYGKKCLLACDRCYKFG